MPLAPQAVFDSKSLQKLASVNCFCIHEDEITTASCLILGIRRRALHCQLRPGNPTYWYAVLAILPYGEEMNCSLSKLAATKVRYRRWTTAQRCAGRSAAADKTCDALRRVVRLVVLRYNSVALVKESVEFRQRLLSSSSGPFPMPAFGRDRLPARHVPD